jgi:sodium-dependent dicarboxylate transporter 2/3/5
MLPTATPPNAIIFGTGHVSIERMMRTGFALNMLGVIIITFMTYLLIGEVFGVVNNVVPDWVLRVVK